MSPVFPPPPEGGATPAEVWAYATRGLSTPNDYKADVTSVALEATSQTIKTETESHPTLGEIEGSSVIATQTKQGTIEGKVDTVDTVVDAIPTLTEIEGSAVIATQAKQTTIEGKVDTVDTVVDKIPGYEAPVEDSVLMITDTEVTLVEKTDNKIGILDGFVDLSTMEAGDTITIRQAMQIKAAGAYVTYAEATYIGVQTVPLLAVLTRAAKDKVKITGEQTAGTVRTLDVQFYRRLQA